MKSLAVKYRPTTWEDVVGQSATKTILKQQLESGEIKNAYLFCGGAGTGKTTCARIFANEINKGVGAPLEMDAASNNSVDNIRALIDKARSISLDSEYKIFILDEVHALSNGAWQAMLKILEEPPKKAIFILCTTDPQKIPNTILSRVQRYDFQRIGQKGIVDRLAYILSSEGIARRCSSCDEEEFSNEVGAFVCKRKGFYADKTACPFDVDIGALEYIAKLADGGMRDAITMLDKCLAYSTDLTLDNVMQALGTSNLDTMVRLYNVIFTGKIDEIVDIIENVHASGKDLKLFIRQFTEYILDINKLYLLGGVEHTKLPNTQAVMELLQESEVYFDTSLNLLDELIKLNTSIKWDSTPKPIIEATLISFARRENK